MEIQLPKLTFEEFVLAPLAPATRRKRSSPLDVDEVISIGGPISVLLPLDSLAEDDEARPFIEARAADFSFHLVHTACTVLPDRQGPLTEVALDFELSAATARGPAPIALSMTPENLDRPVELSRSIKLSAPLKIVDAEVERMEKSVKNHIYVQALNKLRSDPSWHLYRTPTHAIKGMQRFVMIVQGPKGGSTGTLSVKVTTEQKRFGVFRRTSGHEDASPLSFTLSG